MWYILLLLLPMYAYSMDIARRADGASVERSITITEVFQYYITSYSPTLPQELSSHLKDRIVAESMLRHSEFRRWRAAVEGAMRKDWPLPFEAHAFVYDLLGRAAQDMVDEKDRQSSRIVLDNINQLQELTLRLESSERKARIAALSNIGTAVLTAGVTGLLALLIK